MIRLAALSLPLLLAAAPAMAQTSAPSPLTPQRLVLNLADRDGDGVVSPAEAADQLASYDAAELPAAQPASAPHRGPRSRPGKAKPEKADEAGFPGLSMKRRFVEASEFEQALEFRFLEELKDRRK
ncbi:hypothetical protein [Caulobacter endophyticus]|uniref:hypothetical protein n=1 Tax=Caulobacter endophyticus TaxID=2172652 RepID=UPI002410498A|nr:hypothetical protein [Caulobacter endophyticus]MDG2529741.1 hypothetical protein [Caulobacter endophyticus]